MIRYAVWLYFHFTLSLSDVEELLARRAIQASREAVRRWVNKFGLQAAANIRLGRARPTARWRLLKWWSKSKGGGCG